METITRLNDYYTRGLARTGWKFTVTAAVTAHVDVHRADAGVRPYS